MGSITISFIARGKNSVNAVFESGILCHELAYLKQESDYLQIVPQTLTEKNNNK